MAQQFHRLAEVGQLKLEEKWLVNALAVIKQQRNCLQIERLHLESTKVPLVRECEVGIAQTENEYLYLPSTSGLSTYAVPSASGVPSTHAVASSPEVPFAVLSTSRAEVMHKEPPYRCSRNSLEFEASPEDTEIACNEEELDLAITRAILDQDEYEVEEYEEEDGCENIVIDMNMLMNGMYTEGEAWNEANKKR